jgi:hypothetical protein
VPIGIFMLAYLVFTLRRFIGLSWTRAGLGLVAFVALMAASAALPCPPGARALTAGGRCLNGSLGYAPALVMLGAAGAWAEAKGHRAGRYLLAAAALFAVSLTARTVDLAVCDASELWSRRRGTHALWHVLNAGVLGLLLAAAIRHGRLDAQSRCAGPPRAS